MDSGPTTCNILNCEIMSRYLSLISRVSICCSFHAVSIANHLSNSPVSICRVYANANTVPGKGLRPYYVISYNKQGSFQMITDDYNNGPRVVRKDYVLWKIQNMQESASMPSSSGQSQFSIMSLVTLKLKLKN